MHTQVKIKAAEYHKLEIKAEPVKQMSHAVNKVLKCAELHMGESRD